MSYKESIMELNLTTKKHPNKGKHTKYSQALIG